MDKATCSKSVCHILLPCLRPWATNLCQTNFMSVNCSSKLNDSSEPKRILWKCLCSYLCRFVKIKTPTYLRCHGSSSSPRCQWTRARRLWCVQPPPINCTHSTWVIWNHWKRFASLEDFTKVVWGTVKVTSVFVAHERVVSEACTSRRWYQFDEVTSSCFYQLSTPSDTSSCRTGTRRSAGALVRSFEAWLRQLSFSRSAKVGNHAASTLQNAAVRLILDLRIIIRSIIKQLVTQHMVSKIYWRIAVAYWPRQSVTEIFAKEMCF